MNKLSRRDFLGGFAGIVAAPYVCRNSGLLMPIKQHATPASAWLHNGSQLRIIPEAEVIYPGEEGCIGAFAPLDVRQPFLFGAWANDERPIRSNRNS